MPSSSIQLRAPASFSAHARQSWLWFNLLSLDAPLVAIAWQLLFAKCGRVEVKPVAILALGLAVWLIYAIDRLLDIWRSDSPPKTSRHQFHLRHRVAMTACAVFATAALLTLARFMRPVLLRDGFALAGVVGFYLIGIHFLPRGARKAWPKELAVGIVFAAGTCLAPWVRSADARAFILPASLFAGLCCLNCSLIEVWEWKRFGACPAAQPHPLTRWFARNIRLLAGLIALTAAILFFASRASLLFAAIGLSSVAFIWLQREENHLSNNLLRVLADVPLLSPLLLIGLH